MATALVTGATAGIGAAFARRLAADGFDFVLVARDKERLERAADGYREQRGVRAEVLPADLATDDGIARVEERAAAGDVDLLVNNAGFGQQRSLLESDLADELAMLRVHCEAVLRLTRAALPAMIERGGGRGVINVASVAAFYPRGTYSASKAWVVNFSESARQSARRDGAQVNVMALCPGWVRTEFHQRADQDVSAIPGGLWLDADALVDAAVADFRRGAVISVPDARYKATVAASRLIPRGLSAYLAARAGSRHKS